MVSTPSAPNPYDTANAQQGINTQTAIDQSELNDVNQVTPYGSVSYNQTGTSSSGIPQYTATTSLTPDMQNLVNSNISNAQGNSNLEGQVQASAGSTLAQPLDLSDNASMNQTNALNRATLDPQWQQSQDSLQQQLYDQGVTPGSAAYNTAMTNFSTQKNQAYDQMYVADQGQADQNILAQYNEPLNELSALQTGSQVTQPGVGTTAATAQTGIQPSNLSGLVEQNYNDQVAQSNAALGGLFGLGGAIAGGVAKSSDREDKTDIKKLGKDPKSGLPMYAYRYKDDPKSYPKSVGPMAQDIEKVRPDMVHKIGGHKVVNFGLGGR